VCSVYQYHLAFNQKEASNIERDCRQGRMGCVACKKDIAREINSFLVPIREKRAYFEARPSLTMDALRAGIERTLRESGETIQLVRESMHYSYANLLKKG
jgi:tryptophanyl-tRNA synthetase